MKVERLLRKMVLKLSSAAFPITLNPTFQQLGQACQLQQTGFM